jgi:alkylation response protein AidB-like acyl-CoA dehydrogenase
MIPERLTSAAGAVGTAMAALEVAIKYSSKRKAFGQVIRKFEGVNFKIADMIMKIDAARGLVYQAAKAADELLDKNYSFVRRLVSEAKAFATEICWEVINNAMQILGGIGYTTIYPIERLLRDSRLGLIWTGTNEIMRLIIQHEIYKEILDPKYLARRRNIEKDAVGADMVEEKVFE